jgi:NADH-quinone oxidoreductase subunit N
MDATAGWNDATQTLAILLPEWIILGTAIVMMTAAAFVRLPRKVWSIGATVAIVVAMFVLRGLHGESTGTYSSVALNDDLSFYARMFLAFTGLILMGLAHDQVDDARAPEYFGSILMILAGAMLVAAANELIFLFVGLELVSIPTYLLLYISRRTTTTQEAATKYFFLSIFSSGFLLFGLAYLYGMTGVSNLKGLAFLVDQRLGIPTVPHGIFGVIAVVFIMAGLGFRVAAVPFHFYAPDVYEGSPTVLAALLSWVPKAVGFLAMIRTLTGILVLGGAEKTLHSKAVALAWILAVATMTLGNTVALLQNNLRRLLAYSSIAHAGYILIAAAAAFHYSRDANTALLGNEAILFYLLAYALMTLGVFGGIIALSTPERPVETVDDLAGLAQYRPWLAFMITVCLFSLAGIPPLAGFWGKFQIFYAAVAASGNGDPHWFVLLVVIGGLNAAIGAYYYLRIVVTIYLRPVSNPILALPTWPALLSLVTCASLTVAVGLVPQVSAYPCKKAAEAATALPEPTDPLAAAHPGALR